MLAIIVANRGSSKYTIVSDNYDTAVRGNPNTDVVTVSIE